MIRKAFKYRLYPTKPLAWDLEYIVFTCGVQSQPLPPGDKAVGIDLGTNPHFLITSDGEMIEAPWYYQKAQDKLAIFPEFLGQVRLGSGTPGVPVLPRSGGDPFPSGMPPSPP